MPIMTPTIKYVDLKLKAPIVLKAIIPKDNLVGAKSKLGTTVDTTTVDNVRFGCSVYMCKEGEPDCATPTKALTVVFRSERTNNRWVLDVTLESFYVSPSATLTFEIFKFGSETDTVIDVTFRDSFVSVSVNGKSYLDTDTFKKFEQIRQIECVSAYLAPDGSTIDPSKLSAYLAFNLQVTQIADATALFNAIIPLAITLAVIGVVMTLIMSFAKKIPVPKIAPPK